MRVPSERFSVLIAESNGALHLTLDSGVDDGIRKILDLASALIAGW